MNEYYFATPGNATTMIIKSRLYLPAEKEAKRITREKKIQGPVNCIGWYEDVMGYEKTEPTQGDLF